MRLTRRTQSQPNSPIGAHAHLLDQVPSNKPLLNLSQGAPGFPPAPSVQQRMADVALADDGSRYGPLRGLDKLRLELLRDLTASYGDNNLTVDDICITSGCNQAFTMVVSAITEPGDDVILPVPYYFNHDMWLAMDSMVPNYVHSANGVAPTVAEAEAVITDRTRAIVLVTPGNPTGHILEPSLIGEFADLAREKDIALILDETYRSFVPDSIGLHGLFNNPTWRDNIVSLHSFSKDLAIPGQRVGAIVGDPELLTEAAKLIDCISICPPRIGQEAAHAGLSEAGEWRADKVAEIAAKQQRFEDVMANAPGGFRLLSAGAYYGWASHPFANTPTPDIVEQLLLEQGVLAIPGTAFTPTDEQNIRFSFANVELDRIDELTDRLSEFAASR